MWPPGRLKVLGVPARLKHLIPFPHALQSQTFPDTGQRHRHKCRSRAGLHIKMFLFVFLNTPALLYKANGKTSHSMHQLHNTLYYKRHAFIFLGAMRQARMSESHVSASDDDFVPKKELLQTR